MSQIKPKQQMKFPDRNIKALQRGNSFPVRNFYRIPALQICQNSCTGKIHVQNKSAR